jgi:predicted dienelactone hydrolase
MDYHVSIDRVESMNPLRTFFIALALALGSALSAFAQVGMQRVGEGVDAAGHVGADLIWYPTAESAPSRRFGPFEVAALAGASPSPGRHPLVVISHGNGGSEMGHAWLAQRLAADGYVVISVRHPGDNFQDRSAAGRPDYFSARPAYVSAVLDRVLADPRWSALVDERRIAAIGHSAGGYTVLALAGARPELSRALAHCSAGGPGLREDADFCRRGGFTAERPAPATPTKALPGADLRDRRIRAVIADAPLAVVFDPASLSTVAVPVLIEFGGADVVLVPRFHAESLCAKSPRVACVRTAAAGHFALMHSGTGRLGPPGDDPSEDPPGFDRAAWQAEAWPRIREFLAKALS